jgi:predicted TIM-barrel fold metal-dependent hydrolase
MPLSGPFYAGFWRYCESRRVPVLCHVADPEEFWDEQSAPQWAKDRKWTYHDDDYPSKEELYDDVEELLSRHPDMVIVFAHFYFLSADLKRAADFLDRHPNTAYDLTPGIELLYNMSRKPDEWREFFVAYQDRILFGTDIATWQSVQQAVDRIWMVRNFLESDEEFRTPETADDLMTRYDEPFLGLHLDGEVLEKIYAANFRRFWGKQARPANTARAIEVLERDGKADMAAMLRSIC